ncbi:hypothetical protein HDU98_011018 [Podochytrium sp. JEL0797]|nr:hypothetical protein HDU98_011018 [Podochytrium sp. JEL0797]
MANTSNSDTSTTHKRKAITSAPNPRPASYRRRVVHADFKAYKKDKTKTSVPMPCGKCGLNTAGSHCCPGCLVHMHSWCGTAYAIGEGEAHESRWCPNCDVTDIQDAPPPPTPADCRNDVTGGPPAPSTAPRGHFVKKHAVIVLEDLQALCNHCQDPVNLEHNGSRCKLGSHIVHDSDNCSVSFNYRRACHECVEEYTAPPGTRSASGLPIMPRGINAFNAAREAKKSTHGSHVTSDAATSSINASSTTTPPNAASSNASQSSDSPITSDSAGSRRKGSGRHKDAKPIEIQRLGDSSESESEDEEDDDEDEVVVGGRRRGTPNKELDAKLIFEQGFLSPAFDRSQHGPNQPLTGLFTEDERRRARVTQDKQEKYIDDQKIFRPLFKFVVDEYRVEIASDDALRQEFIAASNKLGSTMSTLRLSSWKAHVRYIENYLTLMPKYVADEEAAGHSVEHLKKFMTSPTTLCGDIFLQEELKRPSESKQYEGDTGKKASTVIACHSAFAYLAEILKPFNSKFASEKYGCGGSKTKQCANHRKRIVEANEMGTKHDEATLRNNPHLNVQARLTEMMRPQNQLEMRRLNWKRDRTRGESGWETNSMINFNLQTGARASEGASTTLDKIIKLDLQCHPVRWAESDLYATEDEIAAAKKVKGAVLEGAQILISSHELRNRLVHFAFATL